MKIWKYTFCEECN